MTVYSSMCVGWYCFFNTTWPWFIHRHSHSKKQDKNQSQSHIHWQLISFPAVTVYNYYLYELIEYSREPKWGSVGEEVRSIANDRTVNIKLRCMGGHVGSLQVSDICAGGLCLIFMAKRKGKQTIVNEVRRVTWCVQTFLIIQEQREVFVGIQNPAHQRKKLSAVQYM